jgi:hypothetical protein
VRLGALRARINVKQIERVEKPSAEMGSGKWEMGGKGGRPVSELPTATVPELDLTEILEQLVVEEREPVAHAQIALREGHLGLCSRHVAGNSELGATEFLAPKEIAYRLDGLKLIVEVGLEMEFHGLSFLGGNSFTA